jgi:hypothetical protein
MMLRYRSDSIVRLRWWRPDWIPGLEWLDNILVSYQGYLGHAAKLYVNGHDLKDPQPSPIYGDFHGFPPAILTSGTRGLFLTAHLAK